MKNDGRPEEQNGTSKADIDHFLKENGLLTFRSMDGYETERPGL